MGDCSGVVAEETVTGAGGLRTTSTDEGGGDSESGSGGGGVEGRLERRLVKLFLPHEVGRAFWTGGGGGFPTLHATPVSNERGQVGNGGGASEIAL